MQKGKFSTWIYHIGKCNTTARASAIYFGARRPMPAEGQGH